MAKTPDKKYSKVDRPALLRLREDLRWLQDVADPKKPDEIVPDSLGSASKNRIVGGVQPTVFADDWRAGFDFANAPHRPTGSKLPADEDGVIDLQEVFDRRRRIWSDAHRNLPHELLFDVREPLWELLRPPLERALVWLDEAIGPTAPSAKEIGQRHFRAEPVGDDKHVFIVGDGLLDDIRLGPKTVGDIAWGIGMTLIKLPAKTIAIGDLAAEIDKTRIEGLGLDREIRTKVKSEELAPSDALRVTQGAVPRGLLSTAPDEEVYEMVQSNWRMLIKDRRWRDRWFTFNKAELSVTIHEQPRVGT